MDPGFFLHHAIHRTWSVPTRPLADVADVARNDRLEEHAGTDPVVDTDEHPTTIYPVVRSQETDERSYLQWVEPGDVLLHRARQAFCVCVDRECLASYDFWVIRTEDDLRPAFLALCLRSTYIQEEINRRSTGHVQNRISKNELEQLPLPVPNLERQDDLLDRYHDRVGDYDQETDLLTVVDRLAERLGYTREPPDPVRVVSASDLQNRLDPSAYFSPSYRNEGKVKCVPLESLAEMRVTRYGLEEEEQDPRADLEPPCVQAKDLGHLIIHTNPLDGNKQRRTRRSNGIRIETGMIIVGRAFRDRLRVGYVLRDGGIIAVSNFYQIDVDESRVDPLFLAGFLSTPAAADQLRHRTTNTGGDRTRIRLDTLRELPVPLPNRERQDELVQELRPMHHRRQSLVDGPPPENELLETLLG